MSFDTFINGLNVLFTVAISIFGIYMLKQVPGLLRDGFEIFSDIYADLCHNTYSRPKPAPAPAPPSEANRFSNRLKLLRLKLLRLNKRARRRPSL